MSAASDEKHVDMYPSISDSGDVTYWEEKLPIDYKDIIKLYHPGLQWKTNRELYDTLCKGFAINNGQEVNLI